MSMNSTRKDLARLDEVLSIYGSDEARWPPAEREALSALAERDAEAARLLREARALDKVLAFAPAGRAGDALRDRIVAAAVADGAREAKVVPLSAARKPASKSFGSGRDTFWSATAMAACFALGLYLGVAGNPGAAIGSALDLASVEMSGEEAESMDLFFDSDYVDPEGLI